MSKRKKQEEKEEEKESKRAKCLDLQTIDAFLDSAQELFDDFQRRLGVLNGHIKKSEKQKQKEHEDENQNENQNDDEEEVLCFESRLNLHDRLASLSKMKDAFAQTYNGFSVFFQRVEQDCKHAGYILNWLMLGSRADRDVLTILFQFADVKMMHSFLRLNRAWNERAKKPHHWRDKYVKLNLKWQTLQLPSFIDSIDVRRYDSFGFHNSASIAEHPLVNIRRVKIDVDDLLALKSTLKCANVLKETERGERKDEHFSAYWSPEKIVKVQEERADYAAAFLPNLDALHVTIDDGVMRNIWMLSGMPFSPISKISSLYISTISKLGVQREPLTWMSNLVNFEALQNLELKIAFESSYDLAQFNGLHCLDKTLKHLFIDVHILPDSSLDSDLEHVQTQICDALQTVFKLKQLETLHIETHSAKCPRLAHDGKQFLKNIQQLKELRSLFLLNITSRLWHRSAPESDKIVRELPASLLPPHLRHVQLINCYLDRKNLDGSLDLDLPPCIEDMKYFAQP